MFSDTSTPNPLRLAEIQIHHFRSSATWNLFHTVAVSIILWRFFYVSDDCSSFEFCVFTAIGLDTCPEPQTPTYAIKVGDRYMVGDVVMFQCEQGYSLQVRPMCCLKHTGHLTYFVHWSLLHKQLCHIFLEAQYLWFENNDLFCCRLGKCSYHMHAWTSEEVELSGTSLPR